MVEGASGDEFSLKPLKESRVACGGRRNDLDGDHQPGVAVAAFIDRAHPALRDLVEEVIAADTLGGDGIRHFQAHSARPPHARGYRRARGPGGVARGILIYSNSGISKTH